MLNPGWKESTNTQHPSPITQSDNCIGTYIHGFLDNPSVIEYILKDKVEKAEATTQGESYEDFKNRQYDLLAEHVRKYVDIDKLYEIMTS